MLVGCRRNTQKEIIKEITLLNGVSATRIIAYLEFLPVVQYAPIYGMKVEEIRLAVNKGLFAKKELKEVEGVLYISRAGMARVFENYSRHICLVHNIDPDFGILHVDHATRSSLIFDLMEPHRPKVDRLLLGWILSKTFNKKDFFETREGVCRVNQEIISNIIPLVNELSPDVTVTVKEFTRYFKDKVNKKKPEHFQEALRENLFCS